ncbi:MAG: hypothetical protein ABW170_21785 [Candidatus Thiodiazotropha sp. L084R]
MLALYPLWRKARRVYSLTSRLPGTNRLGFQPSLALSVCHAPTGPLRCSEKPAGLKLAALKQSGQLIGFSCASHSCQNGILRGVLF